MLRHVRGWKGLLNNLRLNLSLFVCPHISSSKLFKGLFKGMCSKDSDYIWEPKLKKVFAHCISLSVPTLYEANPNIIPATFRNRKKLVRNI